MADLNTDIIGQVERLPLRPSEANALLPLYEAISNSLHAINDQFKDGSASEFGEISVQIIRSSDPEMDVNWVEGFIVTDNGIGLNDDNFRSFCTPYSQLKVDRGGKGIGRLGWLKVFKNIDVISKFGCAESKKCRSFRFVLKAKDQISEYESKCESIRDTGTQVTLKGFYPNYKNKCPLNTDTIVKRVISHFLPVFAAEKSPSIKFYDGHDVFDLKKEFDDKVIVASEILLNIEIESQNQPVIVRHMRCHKDIRPKGSQYNWVCFCANDRGVKEYCVDDQIGLKLLENDAVYIGTITGDFLDKHVNPQRTDFIFEPDEGRAIRRQIAISIREFLQSDVNIVLTKKKRIADELIRKNPQYIYMRNNLDEFVNGLKPSSSDEESIFLEMSQNKFRRQRKFQGYINEIDCARDFNDEIAAKVEDYTKYIADDQKGSLAEYVVKRKAVLSLLDTFRGGNVEKSGDHFLEEAIHKLICPMQTESDNLGIEEHNLWILDDRLAFFSFFASDRPINQIADSSSAREPDLALFYDSCLAWRESEKTCDTVILVEFKRPGLEHYTDKNDPFLQLMDYISLFKSSKTVKDKSKKVITGIGDRTNFQCYIVADITNGLQKRLQGRFEKTPDGLGLFGYTKNPDAYIEVIPYQKLFLDAHERNSIFFDKLGLSD